MITKHRHLRIFLALLFLLVSNARGQDSGSSFRHEMMMKGQWSSWAYFNPGNVLPVRLGSRYIPQVNDEIYLPRNRRIDFEASANMFGDAGFHAFDSTHFNGKIKPYRFWTRYSSRHAELRAGLQKINFGSATLLRPLMWFDQVDPRDPLGLTDGVWGVLGRYYFLNNANVWLWGLTGNKNTRGWEQIKTNINYPEFGGRIQTPLPGGEAAVTYHHRVADSRDANASIPEYARISEHRAGIDIRLDLVIGCWVEATWITADKDLDTFTYQEMITAGLDYTFGFGSGLYTVFEHLLVSYDARPFVFSNKASISVISLSYPVGLFDNLGSIIYYSWTNSEIYNILTWKRQFDTISFFFMGYWNPDEYRIPSQGGAQNLYSGKGVQLMFVFNH